MNSFKFQLIATVSILIYSSMTMLAQPDSIVFINKNYITGAVESMDQGIITVSTDYSDSDFIIEWDNQPVDIADPVGYVMQAGF